jgi:cytoskeletal protein CcmA (bactofilin family)
MNLFKQKGFDTIIAEHTKIDGSFDLAPASTTIIHGCITGKSIEMSVTDFNTTMVVEKTGRVEAIETVCIPLVEVRGQLVCDNLICENKLIIRAGATVKAKTITYGDLIIDKDAAVTGELIRCADLPENNYKC